MSPDLTAPEQQPAAPPALGWPRAVQGLAFHRDPRRFLMAATARHGDVVRIDLPVSGPAVVVADPVEMDRLAETDASVMHAGRGRRHVLGMVAPRSVLGADPPDHALLRGRVAPAFAPGRIAGLSDEVDRVVRQHLQRWPQDRPFRLVDRCRSLADHLFLLLVVGVRDPARGAALAREVRRMLATPGNPPMPPPAPDRGRVGALAQRVYERRTAPVERLLLAELHRRRHDGGAGATGDCDDLISCVLRDGPQDDRSLLDQLVPLVIAGQEPPAMALSWTLDRLAREPSWAEAVVEGPAVLRERFVAETLRLRPPVHSLLRDLTVPSTVGGFRLERGTTVLLPMVLSHRDPRTFTEPDAFVPDRWLDGWPDPGAAPPGYRPFGGGAHRCIGEPLARLTLDRALVAGAALGLAPLTPRSDRMVVRATVSAPAYGAPVTVGRTRGRDS
jgi:cytochrome P450